MVYEKYIRRGGKVFGPYYYESYREGGKIKKRYLGTSSPKQKLVMLSLRYIGFILFLAALVLYSYYFFSIPSEITGRAVFNATELYEKGAVAKIDKSALVKEVKTINKNLGINVSVATTQYGAVLGRPVRWVKNITATEAVNVSIEIPANAENVSIKILKQNTTFIFKSNLTNDSLINQTFGKGELLNQSENDSDIDDAIEINKTEANVTISIKNESSITEEVGNESIAITGVPNLSDSDLSNETQLDENVSINVSDDKEIKKVLVGIDIDVAELLLAKELRGVDLIESNITIIKEKITNVNATKIIVDINGNVILRGEDMKSRPILRTLKNFFEITGFVVSGEENTTLIEINESVEEVEVEYYTDAPYVIEEEVENGKRVRIIGPDNVHYENVLAFSELDEGWNVIDSSRIRVYWNDNKTYMKAENVIDRDGNGIYDYIEWIVPHLSNQTFDIILITKAEHLDSNREFIEDVYEEVKERDGNWTSIPEGHYVRVTFERNLTSNRDITIYARSNYSNVSVDVYEINGNSTIASFPEINEDKEYKVFLNNLGQGQCYDSETEVLTDEGWRLFSELSGEERVMTLNSKTGEKEWQKPEDYQKFEHEGEMYKIKLEDGNGGESELLVSPKHKVYVGVEKEVSFEMGDTSILSSYNVMILPSKSSGSDNFDSNLEKDSNNNSGLFCGILNQMIENIVSLGYCSGSVKSESPVINILCSDLESNANFLSEDFLDAFIASTPSTFRNDNSFNLTFSSNKNLRFEGDAELDIISSPHEIRSVLEGCLNVLLCEGGDKGIHDFFYRNSSFKHFQDLPDHNSSAFEGRLTMTNFRVNNNIFINLDSHEIRDDILVSPEHKVYGLSDFKSRNNYSLNLSTRSFVLYTGTSDCFINLFSPDQIGQLSESASAKYWISLPCGQISFALKNLSEKFFTGTHAIRDFSNSKSKSNSASENPKSVISLCTFLSLPSSSNNLVGAYNLTLSENNMSSFFVCIPLPFAIMAENNSLASITRDIIYISGNSLLSSLYMDSSISEASPFAFSSVNFDLATNASNTALCSALDLDRCISNAFAMISSLASFDSSEYDFSISFFNSDGTSNLITTSTMFKEIEKNYINVSSEEAKNSELLVSPEHKVYASIDRNDFELMPITEAYELINSGRDILFLDADNNPVRVLDIKKEAYDGKIYGVDVSNDIVLVRRWNNSEERESYYKYLNENYSDEYGYEDYNKDINVSADTEIGGYDYYDCYVVNENEPVVDGDCVEQGKSKLSNSVQIRGDNHKIPKPPKAVWSGNSEGYSQDTFDLRVVGPAGTAIEFDYIVDPQANDTSNNIYQCGTIDSPGTYRLNQSISGTGTCLNITSDNVIIDGNNYQLTYDTSSVSNNYGIYVKGANHTKIMNITVAQSGTGSSGYGVIFERTTNSTVFNSNVTTRGNSAIGIWITSGRDSMNFTNNNITTLTTNSNAQGINIDANSSIIEGNVITTFSLGGVGVSTAGGTSHYIIKGNKIYTNHDAATSNADGISVGSNSKNNSILNNLIVTIGGISEGIDLLGNLNNILNNTINTSGSSSDGIFYSGGQNSTIADNSITTYGDTGYGISLSSVSYTNLSGNNITTTNVNSNGFKLTSTSNNNHLDRNNVTVQGSGSDGVSLAFSSNNNLSNNVIKTFHNESKGVDICCSPVDNNTFYNLNIETIGINSSAFYLYATANFSVYDSILNASGTNAADFYVTRESGSSTKGGTWNFTNVTNGDGNGIRVNWTTGVNGTLNIRWYLDAYANYTNSTNVTNANISAYDVNGGIRFSRLTGANGRIARQEVLEYTRNDSTGLGPTATYYSNYTFNASNPDATETLTQSWNMSVNRFLVFSFLNATTLDSPVLMSVLIIPMNLTINLSETQTFNVEAEQFSVSGLDQYSNPISVNVTCVVN